MSTEDAFRAAYGAAPAFRVVVPGRVNLIGDHIDYCGLSVLPAAIQKHATLLVRPRRDSRITVRSMESAFGVRSFEAEAGPEAFPAGDWGNYLKAAVAGLVPAIETYAGFDAIFESDIPVAAGLSSSSALVVCTGLAFLESNGASMDPIALAERMATAERYVGTQGGGMDQAIVLCAAAHCAGRIDFRPLRVTHVPVPAGWRFIVAHSGVSAEKSGTAQAAYNERTVDVKNALAAVARDLAAPGASYRDLLDHFDAEALANAARRILDARELDRFLHVVGEAIRVEHAITAMRDGHAALFGRLMTESHASLRDLFAVSIPELDRIVDAFERGGAIGARLTGAGFGGCVVALTREDESRGIIDFMTGETATGDPDAGSERPARSVFEIQLSAGARIDRL